MNDQETPPIMPTRQEVVSLFGTGIVAVLLPDGNVGATLMSLCEALGLTFPSANSE
jgi:hypothetical protein